MIKQIVYRESPTQDLPQLCEMCGEEISEGDKCYYVGDGVYICLSFQDKCINEWDSDSEVEK